MTGQWKSEQKEFESNLKAHRNDNTSELQSGFQLLELAQRAAEMFSKMGGDAKREIASLILSNPKVSDITFCYDYKKRFDQFVKVRSLDEWRG